MRTITIAAIIASLAVPAYAQKGGMTTAREDAEKAEKVKKKDAKETEKAYNDALKRIPDAAVQKKDPWGNIR
jgi:hypothetical protein